MGRNHVEGVGGGGVVGPHGVSGMPPPPPPSGRGDGMAGTSNASTMNGPSSTRGGALDGQVPVYHWEGQKPGAKWQKVCYIRQPYPDNHVDGTFLASLVRNANVQPYEYWPMVRSTAIIIQQVSVMAIFYLTFAMVHTGAVSVEAIIAANVALGVALAVTIRFSGPQFYTPAYLTQLPRLVQYALVLVFVLYALAPVLQTLTQSFCNDAIWAHTITLAAMHIFTHDYHATVNASAVSGAISLNAAMFAAVLMASRLQSTTAVFTFVLLAIELFAVWPMVRDYVRVRSEAVHMAIAATLFVVTLLMLTISSTLLAVVYALGAFTICFVTPWWLLNVQKYKNEIQGPWDEANVAQFST